MNPFFSFFVERGIPFDVVIVVPFLISIPIAGIILSRKDIISWVGRITQLVAMEVITSIKAYKGAKKRYRELKKTYKLRYKL